jgi:hypothetical protein
LKGNSGSGDRGDALAFFLGTFDENLFILGRKLTVRVTWAHLPRVRCGGEIRIAILIREPALRITRNRNILISLVGSIRML